MGQAVKYAALAAGIVIIIALIVVLIASVAPQGVFGAIASSITSFVNNCSDILQRVRGLINYSLGGGIACTALNACIWITLILPLILLPIEITIIIYRWINQ